MSLDTLLSTAESQLMGDDTDTTAPGIPSYLIAANNHQIASGGFSLLDPSSWGEGAEYAGKFTMTAAARAVTSIWNIVPETYNWLGGTAETLDTYNVISRIDQDLGDFYSQNQSSVDIAGDLVASFAPGLAGVKALRLAQGAVANKAAIALAAVPEGRFGWNMAQGIGLLPRTAAVIGKEAGIKMAATSQTFSFMNREVLKSVAAGYGQMALENAAFLGAAQLSMSHSPIFEDQDISDIFWNSVWGAGVGAGIMGSLAAAQTYGAVKSGVRLADKLTNPATLISGTAGLTAASQKLTLALHDIHHPPVPNFAGVQGDEAIAALQSSFAKKLAAREETLSNVLLTETRKLVKDDELAQQFVASLRNAPYEQAVGNIEFLTNIQRAGIAEKTAIEKLADKFARAKNPQGEAPSVDVMYTKLRGEGAFSVSSDMPKILNIADNVKSSQQVLQYVNKQKFNPNVPSAPSLMDDHLQAEARYIWASRLKKLPDTIGERDIPLLEAALARNVPEVTLTDGRVIQSTELLEHIQKAKEKEFWLLRESYPEMSLEEISKRVNVKEGFMRGTAIADDAKSNWIAQDYSKGEYLNPTYAKLAYNVKPMLDQNGFVMDAITHAKAMQKEYRQAVNIAFNEFFPNANAVLPERIPEQVLADASRTGVGGGMFAIQNENYGTIGSYAQRIGSLVNKFKTSLIAHVDETFQSHNYKVLNTPAAREDMVKIYNAVLGSSERYVLGEDGVLRMAKYEKALKEGKGVFPKLLDQNSPLEIQLTSQEAKDWVRQWIAHNDTQLGSSYERLAYQLGTKPQDLRGTLYVPPPDPKNYNHFAFVVDPSVTGTGHVRMIHAADAQKLEQLASKVKTETGLKVLFKQDSEEFHKAMGDYNYNLGINENYINHALTRKGVSAPYFAVTDANKIISEMMDWRRRMDVSNFREWIKAKYANEFETMTQLAKQHDRILGSTKSYAGKYGGDAIKNPYRDVMKTMLDVSSREEYPIWTPLNRLLENGVSRVIGKLHDIAATDADLATLDRMSGVLKEAGISANFTDPATMLLANHTAPRPVLEEFIRKANSALSFLMLRSDPLNAMNNGFGHSVLFGTEMRDVIKNIQRGNAEAAGELAGLARIKIPGGDLGDILSPTKLAAAAYKDYAKMLAGDESVAELFKQFKANNWLPDLVEQERSIANAATLRGTESASELAKRMQAMEKSVKALANKIPGPLNPVKLNQGVEDMNRFVAAHAMKQITDVAVKHGVMAADDAGAYINTFVNRVNGNYIANQRPMLFQGPIGQAVSLFQTYQFNLMQQLFRYVGEGGNKSAAFMMGMQGTVYGLNGLPGFQAINTHLIGNAEGNTAHKDVFTTVYGAAGKEAGDWLMYGLASNILIHPDAKVNLYSRGEINPRQVTVIPVNPADIPAIGAVTKFFTSVKDTAGRLSAGGDVYSTILRGVEHAGISRPLAGLAQTAQALGTDNLQVYSTTQKGSIIGSNDLFSLTTLARIAGGRPLDEAIANDAVYRLRAYSAAKTQEINELGFAVKTKIQTNSLTQDDLNGFMKEYVKRGGKQDQFSKFMARQLRDANTATANQLVNDLKNPVSQQMQVIMGGYELQDLANAR